MHQSSIQARVHEGRLPGIFLHPDADKNQLKMEDAQAPVSTVPERIANDKCG